MAIKPKSFFHPVLSKFSSDYQSDVVFNIEFTPSIVENRDRNQVSLGYEVFLTSACLRDFVIDKRASISLDIYCGDTMFRKLFKVSEMVGSIELPAGVIKGSLDVQPLIIVTDSSVPFTFDEISAEYQTNSFQLDLAVPLAIAPSVSIPIDFARSSVKEIVIIKHAPTLCEKNSYKIELAADQIIVHMGTNAHSVWNIISSDTSQKPILFFSVYKDCIAAVLEELVHGIGGDEYRWSEYFLSELERRHIKLPRKDSSFSEINDVALQILGSRGFEKVVTNVN